MFTLQELGHDYTAFEPYIDSTTMELHYTKHHAGYVSKLNTALEEHDLSIHSMEEIMNQASTLPLAVRNNAGGHYNHTLFWKILTKDVTVPSHELKAAITEAFGSLDDLKVAFNQAALSVFGSGWAWLVVDDAGKLSITTTKNQDNPLFDDVNTGFPLLGLDVWEHAYYLHYQNRRLEYIEAFWKLVNWDEVSFRFQEKPSFV